jgi:hypothetical protein
MGLTLPPPQAVLPMGALQYCTVCTMHIMGTGGLKGRGGSQYMEGRRGWGVGGGRVGDHRSKTVRNPDSSNLEP